MNHLFTFCYNDRRGNFQRRKVCIPMEQRLQEALLPGEELRWTGRPSPFKLLAGPYRSTFLSTWLLSAAAVLLAVFYLAPMLNRMQRGGADVFVVLLAVAFLPAMLSARPLLDKLYLERSTLYAITNYRAIALIRGELMYIPLNKRLDVAVERQDREYGNLCFGAAVGQRPSSSRSNAVLGIRKNDQESAMMGMLFYHVPHPEHLLSYLT